MQWHNGGLQIPNADFRQWTKLNMLDRASMLVDRLQRSRAL